MKDKPLKKQYQLFINEMIKHGDQVLAYRTAYPKASDETARVESYRLLQNPTIHLQLQAASDKIRENILQSTTEALKQVEVTNILTSTKKREILRQIAEGGEIQTVVRKDVWDAQLGRFVHVETPITRRATILERMRAIMIDNLMSGDNAPLRSKIEADIKDEGGMPDLSTFTPEELRVFIKAYKKSRESGGE